MPKRGSLAQAYGNFYAPARPAKMARRRPARPSNAQVLAAVAKAAGGELKGMDTEILIAGPVVSTTGTNGDAVTLNLVETGAGSYNRIGRKITLKSVRIKGTMVYTYSHAATSADQVGSTLRMVVVWDKQPSGVLPVFSDIFGSTSQDGTESSDIFDNLRFDNTGRFSVLRDKMLTVNPQLSNSEGGSTDRAVNSVPVDEFINLKGKQTIFSGDSDPTTIADISSGGLYVFFRADASTADTSDWSLSNGTTKARLRFVG